MTAPRSVTTLARRIRTVFRDLARDDAGAAQPLLVVASVVLFGLISASVVGGLQAAMTTMQQQKVNTALAAQVTDLASREAARGYPVVSALPGSETLEVRVGGTARPAIRTVTVDADALTALVTVKVGKYVHGTWMNAATCDATPSNCVSAKDVATPTLAQTIPTAHGLTGTDPRNNVTESREKRWLDVAVGNTSSIALDEDGLLWGWGTNGSGEVGNGTTTPQVEPVRIDVAGVTFTDVEASESSSYAIDRTGRLWAWGSNADGRLGIGSGASAVNTPTLVPGGVTWSDLAIWTDHACGVSTAGELYCWGKNDGDVWRAGSTGTNAPKRIAVPDDPITEADESTVRFSAVAVGVTHQLAIDVNGELWAWGKGPRGQLGTGTTAAVTPVRVADRGMEPRHPIGATPIVSVDATQFNSFAVDTFGRLWAWGANANSMVGDGSSADRTEPTRVSSNVTFRSVTGATQNAFAVARDGRLYGWGRNNVGQVGIGATSATVKIPTLITDQASFIDVQTPSAASAAVDTQRAFAIDTAHRMWSWGGGKAYAWGDGTTVSAHRPVAQQMILREGVALTQVAAGANHTAGIAADGTAWTWGAGGAGQLGTGATANSDSPSPVTGRYADRPATVSVGEQVLTVLSSMGSYYAAGRNTVGQLGTGTTTDTATIARPHGVSYEQVDTGTQHTLALGRDDGNVYAWGRNNYGQLGDGSTTNRTSPVAVQGLPAGAIVKIAASGNFSLALDRDGGLWSWGQNAYGQLGIGTTTASSTAQRVPLDARIVDIAGGTEHALAVDSAGGLWSWGRNQNGQLGTGSVSETAVTLPTKVTTTAPLLTVSAGGTFSTAITVDGRLFGWGGNNTNLNGHGNTGVRNPRIIPTTKDARFVMVQSAATGSVAIDTAGDVWAWGTGANGRIGTPTTPVPVKVLTGVSAVSADTGTDTSAVVTASGTVYATGPNTTGTYGNGTTTGSETFVEVAQWKTASAANPPVPAAADGTGAPAVFTQIAAGGNVTAAVDAHGYLWAWGDGAVGQLGNGTTAGSAVPALALTAAKFTSVAVGGSHIAATTVTGAVYVFGAAEQVGRGAAATVPVRVPLPAPVSHIDAGSGHTVVSTGPDGAVVYGWGRNDRGQVPGAAAGAQVTFPTAGVVPSSAQLVAGDTYTLVLGADRKVVQTWGAGPWAGSTAPLTATYNDVAGAGGILVGALAETGSHLQAYGIGTQGAASQVGGNTVVTVERAAFSDVDAGAAHVVALDADGNVWTWGQNTTGQLGQAGEPTDDPGIRIIGANHPKPLAVQSTPYRATAPWTLATIDPALTAGAVQVNLDTRLPVLRVEVLCADGSSRAADTVKPSSGAYQYANVDITDTAGCGSPQLVATIDGEPVAPGEVQAVVVPLVHTAPVPVDW